MPIIWKYLLKYRHITDFQVGQCSFASIYLKVSTKEGEIFSSFLILGAMSTMLLRSIFDIRANYVEIFVEISAYNELSRLKMFLCANLSQNLYEVG